LIDSLAPPIALNPSSTKYKNARGLK